MIPCLKENVVRSINKPSLDKLKSPDGQIKGLTTDIPSTNMCSVSSQTICRNTNTSIAPRQGWETFTNMPSPTPPPKYYKCDKEQCVVDTQGKNYKNNPNCGGGYTPRSKIRWNFINNSVINTIVS